MGAHHATFWQIERRFADVSGELVVRCSSGGPEGNPGRLHHFREGHSAVGTELRSLEEGAEVQVTDRHANQLPASHGG